MRKIRTVKAFDKKIKALTAKIAKDRDALRDLISEVEDITECCDRAIESLESAADSLSELL